MKILLGHIFYFFVCEYHLRLIFEVSIKKEMSLIIFENVKKS